MHAGVTKCASIMPRKRNLRVLQEAPVNDFFSCRTLSSVLEDNEQPGPGDLMIEEFCETIGLGVGAERCSGRARQPSGMRTFHGINRA